MSNPFQLTIALRQHTPIIHFQHEQAGATLRATELKPKIDVFIKTHFNGLFSQFEPELYEKTKHLVCDKYFPLNGEPVGSPYKLSILPKGEQKSLIPKSIFTKSDNTREEERLEGAFFGDTDKFRANYSTGGLEVQIFSLIPGMKELIQAVIPFVVAMHNFGCRQSKGFGCFSATKLNDQNHEIFNQNWHERVWRSVPFFKAVFRKNDKKYGFQDQIKTIKSDYQLLKGGKNGPYESSYKKSRLFLYMANRPNGIRWEKRKLKQFIVDNYIDDQVLLSTKWSGVSTPRGGQNDDFSLRDEPRVRTYDYRFVRALLGLAEQYEFSILGGGDSKKYLIQIQHQPKVKKDSIERFGSPILFKVFNDNIYALALPVEPEMFDQAFRFSLSLKGYKSGEPIVMEQDLHTPSETEFDLIDFLVHNLNYYTKLQ